MATEERINPAYLQPGTHVGPYKILDLVGHGGFGYLYRVERDGKTYALKLSRERFGDLSEEDRAHHEERVDREIQALKSLRHANIVRVHSFDRWPELESGYPYLIMDFVAGERLYNWRQQTTPSLRRMCDVTRKIALAVDYMHRLGLFHRDLKSENILVRSSDGEPILVDFGIARAKTSYTVTRAQNTLGTITHYSPEYAAWSFSPEFHKGEPFSWQATTDLHSLGYVAYELFTGRSPFPRANTETEQLHMIMSVVPALPSLRTQNRIPGVLDTIIMKLLEKDPANRFQTGRDLANALADALEHADASWDVPFDLPPPADTNQPTQRPQRAVNGMTVVSPSQLKPTAVLPPPPVIPLMDEHSHSQVHAAPEPVAAAAPPTSTPAAPAPFNPPTAVRAPELHLTSVGTPARTAPSDGRPSPILPTGIREHVQQLATPPPRKVSPALLLGGGLIVIVIALFAVLAASTRPAPQSNRDNLLADIEAQRKLEGAGRGQEALLPPPQVASVISPTTPDVPVSALPTDPTVPPALPPSGPPSAPPSTTRSPSDARAIDRTLDQRYARPTVPKNPKAEPAPEPSTDPAWLRRSTRIASASSAPATKGLGVPLGAHLPVKLLSNLDSRTVSGAPVEAMLPSPYFVGGSLAIPARSIFYGQAAVNGDRFTVRFTHLRLPDNTVVQIQALALDGADKKAGLTASRRIKGAAPEGPGVGSRIAKGTANTLLNQVQGGLAQDLARNAGSQVVNDSNSTGSGAAPNAIMLDAPVTFILFASAAF